MRDPDLFDPWKNRMDDSLSANSGRGNHEDQTVEFTVFDVLARSWLILRSNIFAICSTVLIAMFLASILQTVGAALQPDQPGAPPNGGGLLLILAGFFVSIYFVTGLIHYLLNLSSGRKYAFADLFRIGPIYWKAVAAVGLFLGVIAGTVVLMSLTLGILASVLGPVGLVLGLPAVVCGYFFVLFSFSQFLFLLVDREVSPLGSLSLSARVMKGHTIEFLFLTIICGIVNFFGALAFGIGLLITVPLTYVALAVFYLAVTGQPVADPYRMNSDEADQSADRF